MQNNSDHLAGGAGGGVPLDKAHLFDLRYIRMFLCGLSDEKHRSADLSAAINGINYIISRTEAAVNDLPRWRWVDCSPHEGYFERCSDGVWVKFSEISGKGGAA